MLTGSRAAPFAYEATLRAIDRLMEAKRGTPEGDRLDVLVTLVEAYEVRHFPLELHNPGLPSAPKRSARRHAGLASGPASAMAFR